jgi:hypothetical protein
MLHIYIARSLRTIAYRFPALRSSSASTSAPTIPAAPGFRIPVAGVTVEPEATGSVQISVSDGSSFAFTIQSPRIYTMARHRYHGGRVPCTSVAFTCRPPRRTFGA